MKYTYNKCWKNFLEPSFLGAHTTQIIPEHVWMWQWADVFYISKKDIIIIFKLFSVIKMYCCHWYGLFTLQKTIIM